MRADQADRLGDAVDVNLLAGDVRAELQQRIARRHAAVGDGLLRHGLRQTWRNNPGVAGNEWKKR
ncbi:hypothetical protein Misp02_44130 [Microtetraspora sp. NBRC 16547]|nr:hypothetical protein Misp02_44130 [Microtetraspora sp. NBRC 16547]